MNKLSRLITPVLLLFLAGCASVPAKNLAEAQAMIERADGNDIFIFRDTAEIDLGDVPQLGMIVEINDVEVGRLSNFEVARFNAAPGVNDLSVRVPGAVGPLSELAAWAGRIGFDQIPGRPQFFIVSTEYTAFGQRVEVEEVSRGAFVVAIRG